MAKEIMEKINQKILDCNSGKINGKKVVEFIIEKGIEEENIDNVLKNSLNSVEEIHKLNIDINTKIKLYRAAGNHLKNKAESLDESNEKLSRKSLEKKLTNKKLKFVDIRKAGFSLHEMIKNRSGYFGVFELGIEIDDIRKKYGEEIVNQIVLESAYFLKRNLKERDVICFYDVLKPQYHVILNVEKANQVKKPAQRIKKDINNYFFKAILKTEFLDLKEKLEKKIQNIDNLKEEETKDELKKLFFEMEVSNIEDINKYKEIMADTINKKISKIKDIKTAYKIILKKEYSDISRVLGSDNRESMIELMKKYRKRIKIPKIEVNIGIGPTSEITEEMKGPGFFDRFIFDYLSKAKDAYFEAKKEGNKILMALNIKKDGKTVYVDVTED